MATLHTFSLAVVVLAQKLRRSIRLTLDLLINASDHKSNLTENSEFNRPNVLKTVGK